MPGETYSRGTTTIACTSTLVIITTRDKQRLCLQHNSNMLMQVTLLSFGLTLHNNPKSNTLNPTSYTLNPKP